ncbi:hypothetical protein AURDEDRAFT_116181 [Auricularia subglabra TFB-10046 SS5]|nr:hypothetical protein AURDEDRAFT_116181 [Auricularia subglabra TFB-10046 SS5]
MKRSFSTIVVTQEDALTPTVASEKVTSDTEKLGMASAVHESACHTENQPTALPKSLIIWAIFILPVNFAAWYLTNFDWITDSDGKIELWELIFVSILGITPAMTPLHVLLCAFFLSLKNTRDEPAKAEKYRTLMRSGMLDGVFLAPVFGVYAAYIYPEKILGQCIAWGVAAAAYASQSVVWAHFFGQSRRESQERAVALGDRDRYGLP